MKKVFLLLLLALASFATTYAQSMLCTYKGGYFIRNGNTWYEYRPQKKDDVWNTYTQYSTDNNYYYIRNNRCSLSIPKKNKNSIWIEKGKDKWEVLYTTINVYSYCPVRSSQIYTYKKGFYVKNGNNWKLYLPEKKRDGSWATYTQYDKDENYYYIKNSSDNIAIPRKSNNDFFWRKNGKWEKLHTTLALYDAKSPNAKSGMNYVASNSSSSKGSSGNNQNYSSNRAHQSNNSGSSNIRQKRKEIANGYEIWYYSGDRVVKIYKEEKCNSCYGSKICSICSGTGGRWGKAYGGTYYPCSGCFQTGVCKYCFGKGFRESVTLFDDAGNATLYTSQGVFGSSGSLVGSSSSSSSTSTSSSSHSESRGTKAEYYDMIHYSPNYTGTNNDKWCNECGKVGPAHSHQRIRIN